MGRNSIKGTRKPGGWIRETLTGAALLAVWIFKIVYHDKDYDIEFDAGGKAAIIVTMALFFVIYYIQIKKMDKSNENGSEGKDHDIN